MTDVWISVFGLVLNAAVAVIAILLRTDLETVHKNVNSNFQAMQRELTTAKDKIEVLERRIVLLKEDNPESST